MNAYCKLASNASETMENGGQGPYGEQWQRWDEELVEEFGRWLGRLAKTLGVLLLAASVAILIGAL